MRHRTLTQDHTLPVRIQKILIKGTFDKTTKTKTVLSHGFKIYQKINALEQANTQTEIQTVNDMIKQQYKKARQTQTARSQQPYHTNTQNNQN
jgi:hypothetical protein